MERAALASFAELFAYPRGDVAAAARRCPAVAAQPALRRFVEWAEGTSQGEREEAYIAAFDLDPMCVPYLGHQLCPDRRGLFLAGLSEVYAGHGFRPREELGDHLCEVLRFLAVAPEGPARTELLCDGLVPALAKMAPALAAAGSPYAALLEALSAQLRCREEARP